MSEASPSSPLRLLLVDDHVVVRAGLRALLDGEPGLTVVGETGDATDGVRLAERLGCRLVTFDELPPRVRRSS